MTSDKLVIGLTGMPGAGKSAVVKVAKERDYKIVVMGDVVREEVEKRRMKPTPKDVGKMMLELRRMEGEAVIARRCIPKIEKVMEQKVLIDGVRSLSEVEEFKKHFLRFSLIAVHASSGTRFERLYRRKRSDDPKNWRIFHERDVRELRVGLGSAIAMAEYILVNEGRLEAVKAKIREVLRRVEERWMK